MKHRSAHSGQKRHIVTSSMSSKSSINYAKTTPCCNKKRGCRRGNARRTVSVELLRTTAQLYETHIWKGMEVRNYNCDKNKVSPWRDVTLLVRRVLPSDELRCAVKCYRRRQTTTDTRRAERYCPSLHCAGPTRGCTVIDTHKSISSL